MSGNPRWFVVVNPASGGGRAARRWPALAGALQAAGVGFEAAHTSRPGHATQLAREALAAGFRRLLAAGGDGILHEVVNGVMGQSVVAPREIIVGAAPLGSGNDWARAHGIPVRPGDMAACMAACRTVPHDVGLLQFPKAARTCHFINVAGAGFDAYVLERLPAGVPRRLGYLLGVLRSLGTFQPPDFELQVDGVVTRARLLLTLVAIGPYCGGGMLLAPGATTDDGKLDVVEVDPVRMPRDLPKLRRIFDGRLLEESFVRHALATEVLIAADPPVPVEADGQLVGTTPVKASLLPGALRTLRC